MAKGKVDVRPVEGWKLEVIEEKRELDEKIASLQEAIRKSVLGNLRVSGGGFDDETTLELLEQLVPMQEYSLALKKRIERF